MRRLNNFPAIGLTGLSSRWIQPTVISARLLIIYVEANQPLKHLCLVRCLYNHITVGFVILVQKDKKKLTVANILVNGLILYIA